MSLSAIQDNLVKIDLVQQAQSRTDDIGRSLEASQAAARREEDRQADQVVLMSREAGQTGINPDEERNNRERENREREGRDRRRREDGADDAGEADAPPRPTMHRINVVV